MLEGELGLSPHVLGRGIFQGQHHINGLLESTDAQLKEDLALLVRGRSLCGRSFRFCCAQRVCMFVLFVSCGWVGVRVLRPNVRTSPPRSPFPLCRPSKTLRAMCPRVG